VFAFDEQRSSGWPSATAQAAPKVLCGQLADDRDSQLPLPPISGASVVDSALKRNEDDGSRHEATDQENLTGRVALVIGAGRGIGANVAELLVADGVRTALVARRFEDVSAVCRKLRNSGGVAIPLSCDISRPGSAAEVAATVATELGPVDLLINNAASVAPLGPTVTVQVDEWAATIRLNLVGALATISAVLPSMLARNFGRIVNVTSGAAEGSGMLHASAYSASKAGVEMLTRNLAAELSGTGVTVAAVRPGRVDTDMQRLLRAQTPEAAGPVIVERAWSFLNAGELIDPIIPAQLIVRMMRQALNGVVISVYDERGREILSDIRYAGDGSNNS